MEVEGAGAAVGVRLLDDSNGSVLDVVEGARTATRGSRRGPDRPGTAGRVGLRAGGAATGARDARDPPAGRNRLDATRTERLFVVGTPVKVNDPPSPRLAVFAGENPVQLDGFEPVPQVWSVNVTFGVPDSGNISFSTVKLP